MAETQSSNNSGIVAIFAILVLVMIGGFLAWQMGVFGGGGGKSNKLDINVNTPSSK
ncbi:MAG: hypothetical protein H0T79_16455 [Deltaproteobacteria bacterium]|nr:hypothetical protein [Deltaproteobacteria bacterium]